MEYNYLTEDAIKILVIYFSYNKQLEQEKNFSSVIFKSQNNLKIWKLRNLTIEGRRKNVFACLYSIHNTISLSCHEQVCLSGQKFGTLHEFACHPCTGSLLRVCYGNTYIKIGTIHSR